MPMRESASTPPRPWGGSAQRRPRRCQLGRAPSRVRVRGSAAEALVRISPVAPEVVPALITALADAHARVRVHAAEALGSIGPAATEAVPARKSAVEGESAGVRRRGLGAD